MPAGTTYAFKVKARNAVGFGDYSTVLSIVAGTVPLSQGAPSTSIDGDEINPTVTITWPLPSDNGGLSIDGFRLEIKTSLSSFEIDSTNCNAEISSLIITSRACTVPVSTLRTEPYNLDDSDSVYAQVTSLNAIGESVTSNEGNGATIPIPPTEPDAPTSLVKDSATKTQIIFSWSAPVSNGGSVILDYSIDMDDAEVETGVTSTTHT